MIPSQQRNWGKTVFILSFLAFIADLGLMAIFFGQTKQSEQTLLGQWKTFTYPFAENSQDNLWAFTLDAQGRAWVSGEGIGLNMLKPDGTWVTYTTQNSKISSDNIYILTSSPAGYIGVGAENGIKIFLSDGLQEVSTNTTLSSDPVFLDALVFDPQNHLWAGKWGMPSNIYLLSGDGSWEAYEIPDSYSTTVNAILFDNQNRLWTGGDWTGVHRLDNHRTWTTLDIPDPEGDPRPISVSDMALDQQGRIWVAGSLSGLFIINPDDTWEFIKSDQAGIEISIVDFIAIDSQGNVWMIGTSTFDDSGLDDLIQIAKNGKWSFYTIFNSGMPNDDIIGLEIDKQDRIWIGHDKGVTVLDVTSAPQQQQAEVSSQLGNQSQALLGIKIAALGLLVMLGVSILSATSILSRTGVLAFTGCFVGGFVLNTLFFPLQEFGPYYLCSGSGTGALGCVVISMVIIKFLTYIFDAGVLIYLARKKQWAGFLGFVTAVLVNLIVLFIIGWDSYFQFFKSLILFNHT